MKRPILYPYRIASEGARRLAKALGTICVFPDGHYTPRPGHLILCWGAATFPNWWRKVPHGTEVVNSPKVVSIAINKLRTFEIFDNFKVSCPPWTSNRAKAVDWQGKDKIVVARKSLTSSEGRGIVIADSTVKLPECNLYTMHVRHRREYRVHVFDGKVVDIAEKRKREVLDGEVTKLNSLIRNFRNGWVFCHENVKAPQAVLDESIRAVKALSLTFGAVDVGYREKDGKAFVFEVNTAPGIEGQTVAHYAAAVRQLCNS